jgi:hypothetical protein
MGRLLAMPVSQKNPLQKLLIKLLVIMLDTLLRLGQNSLMRQIAAEQLREIHCKKHMGGLSDGIIQCWRCAGFFFSTDVA